MKKQIGTCLLALFCFLVKAQVIIIGHNKLNNEPVQNTRIFVKDGDQVIQKLDTKNSTDFNVKLDFGKIYRIYFQNAKSPVMYMEVIANNIPVDKYEYKMVYELNVPFYPKNDEDVDTTAFVKPFHKVIYNGATKMVDDTAYNSLFVRKIIKPEQIQPEANTNQAVELPVILTGRACVNNNMKLPVAGKMVTVYNKKGVAIKNTKTNRFGAFVFTGIKASDIGKIKLETKNNDLNNGALTILNSADKQVIAAKCTNGNCDMPLTAEQVKSLTDNAYTTNVGGKLIISSKAQKKFFANKTVYLANKNNTAIKKTKTSAFGTFVFENIKPDNTYYIGVDAQEVGSGETLDLLNKDDKYVAKLDTIAAARKSVKLKTDYNELYNDISISNDEMKMSVKAKLYGDNTNNPLGKLKILLLNDAYQVIDSAITDDFGAFRFKYLPFLKRFYLSAENNNNLLDVFNNILVYSSDDNVIKILTHEKGAKFNYKPIDSEMAKLKDIELDDPWLDLLFDKPQKKTRSITTVSNGNKTIIENILFDNNKYDLLPQAREILDKVIMVLNTNKSLKLELSAHTDSKGNDDDNLKLSQMRAKTVRLYILEAGVDESRLISVGYGEAKLLNKCGNNVPCSEIEHAQNRRVEFKILEE